MPDVPAAPGVPAHHPRKGGPSRRAAGAAPSIRLNREEGVSPGLRAYPEVTGSRFKFRCCRGKYLGLHPAGAILRCLLNVGAIFARRNANCPVP